MSFFFDGTGNNREADIGPSGIGTDVKEIGDPGTIQGQGFSARGENRIKAPSASAVARAPTTTPGTSPYAAQPQHD